MAGDLEASDDVQPVGGPEPVAEAEPQAAPAALRDRGSNDEAEPSRLAEPDGEPAADAVPVVDAEPEYQAGGAVVSEEPVGELGSAEPPAPAAGAGPAPAGEAPALPELDDPETLRAALEAILIVVDEPVSEVVLAQVLERPTATVAAAVRELAESYTRERRGFELRQAAGGWRIYTRDDFAPYVERFVLDGQQVRLTQAALETLAVVAYKQPVSRSRVSAIRGVNCDGVVRTLLTRGLIEECGAEPESGAYLYRTTTLFLERMGLNSTDELPDLAPFLPDELPEEAS
ncbi:SMC-Scp complex subunit ScpB [Actinocatenispora sera]|uniref:SMC-Scp complex subunit ScpB n=1 Tax=Actinocatenispora sera TaxID=390989 RepID=UPI003F4CE09C